jgi:CubicO group peptidase (beta-lactamase class C family)
MRTGYRCVSLALPAAFALLMTIAHGSNAAPDATLPTLAQDASVPLPPARIQQAIAQLDGMAERTMAHSGIPGMSIAVVHGGKTVYAKGFGVRKSGDAARVDADTVFQLASLSKPIGATVIARRVGHDKVAWSLPIRASLPRFALSDPYASAQVTIADLYAHRSGLPDHAGDKLEDLGYSREEALERLRFVPLSGFRTRYAYTNFGITAAAEAVASLTGRDWATLSEETLYRPLGMASTSSRFTDYKMRANRAVTHVKVNGAYVPGEERDPDEQSPAGGVSSSANDMAKWLAFLIDGARAGNDGRGNDSALREAMSAQIVSRVPETANDRPGYYGYGFNVGVSPSGRMTMSHSGAFLLGAATSFMVIPSADVGIVVLTNASPTGAPESIVASFNDLVQVGHVQRNWTALFESMFAPLLRPTGLLVGAERPRHPVPRKANATYTGTYRNAYYGPLQVVDEHGTLTLRLGPRPTSFRLSHWDGDEFTFMLNNENAPPGTISKASFSDGKVLLEYYDDGGLGTFVR